MTLRVIDHAAASDVGRLRRANEDSYFVRVPLFVVADGMGGAQAGEVASKIAAEAFADDLDESLAPERRLAEVVAGANREIHRQSVSDPDMQGMGTTLTAALLGDEELTLAHVGDSRAYRLRDGELTRLTTDHSLVGEMVRRGAITESEAERHPQRSILTRALGPEDSVEIDTLSYGVREGDVYVLCSDGLTTMLDDAEIAESAASGGPMREIANDLIARANDAGGADNITVVAFKVGGAGTGASAEAGAPDSDQATGEADRTIVAPAAVATEFSGAAKARSEPGIEQRPAAADSAESSVPIQPRPPQTAAAGNGRIAPKPFQTGATDMARRRRRRLWMGIGLGSAIFLLAALGAVVGSLNVYFLGVDEHGLVTVYRGLPYEGPVAMKMYTKDYVSTTPADSLAPARRKVLLDHTLRSRSDAIDLITQVERGDVQAIDRDATRERGGNGATGGGGAP
ncbi:MAG: Stp1/IreP family PP2C-type Ser/Thr phosphatase [Actinobacteria bacterium]|nr:Stp1/IreP family PP2C-type Ser/Thr phosphatase [Actinomycetota bacterium]